MPRNPADPAGDRPPELVVTLRCPDTRGIVLAVAREVYHAEGDILESRSHTDRLSGCFFLRTQVRLLDRSEVPALTGRLRALADRLGGEVAVHDAGTPVRVLVMVSRQTHCLHDLLWRASTGDVPVEIAAVVSNWTEAAAPTLGYGVPFHHLPVSERTARDQEEAVLELLGKHRVDLVVLARYMRVLSPAFCDALAGRLINIHHSLLPSFVGARPYARAFERGVKLVGATAHYATADLDEGPIIEQDVARADRVESADELSALGRDVECRVLRRAVRWHAEHRVLLNGARTVVFPR